MGYRIRVDLGGTSPIGCCTTGDSEMVWLVTTLRTPHDQSEGILEGIRLIGEPPRIEPVKREALLHGTTMATNASLSEAAPGLGSS